MPQKRVRKTEFVRADPVPRHQQPSGKARLHDVEAVARGGLCDLGHQCARIAADLLLQLRAFPDFVGEARRLHPHRRSGSLHQRANGRDVRSQRQGNADHALTSDHTDFQGQMAVYYRKQGDERVAGKVDVLDPLPRFVQDFAKSQRHRFETREQALILLARQCGKHAVRDRCSPCNSHEVVLSYPGTGGPEE